jgi:hypothetical protein
MLSGLVLVEFVVPNTARAPADRGKGSDNEAVSKKPQLGSRMEKVDSLSQARTH